MKKDGSGSHDIVSTAAEVIDSTNFSPTSTEDSRKHLFFAEALK